MNKACQARKSLSRLVHVTAMSCQSS